MKPRTPQNRAGFTIVEVVMAMFILLIGMTSILGLLSFGAALSRTAQLRSESSFAVDAIVADLQETMFPLVETEDGRQVAGEPVDVLDQVVPGRPELAYSARAWPEPAGDLPTGPVLYRVDIEIRWSSEGATRTRRYQTLLKREVPFGERLRRQFVLPD
ncbi:MAG: prepilin-type N-terminal cleavage/methylation domain-containing protein [Planctomycetota bacterium]